MWDLQQIVEQNNQAALNAMMDTLKIEEAEAPQPENWQLTALADKLRVGPPVISELIDGLQDLKTLQSFLKLIRTFLPEHEQAIMSQPRNRRVYKFCYLYGKQYYPLPDGVRECSIYEFISEMPVQIMGMSYSAYHGLDMRPGYLLLLSLVIYPYEGDERDMEDDDVPFDPFDPMARYDMEQKFVEIAEGKEKKSEWRPKRSDIAWVMNLISTLADGGKWIAPMGFTIIKIDDRNIEIRQADNTPEVRDTVHRTVLIAEKAGIKVKVKIGRSAEEKQGKTLMEVFNGARVPLLDLVERMVGRDMAKRIPGDGWQPDELRRMTAGTKYKGVADFADWVCSETRCTMLDVSYDGCDFMEDHAEPKFRWSQHNVETLAKDWPKVREIRQSIDQIVEWLEDNHQVRFNELLSYLLSPKATKLKGKRQSRQRGGYDPTEHMVDLNQMYEEEDDD